MKLPTVDGPGVSLAAAPNVYQRTPQAIGDAGRAQVGLLRQAGGAVNAAAEYALKEQNKADLDSAFRAETAMKDGYLQFEREELNKAGIDAKGATERAQKWWGEAEAKYGEGLTERAKFAYQRSYTQVRQASTSTLMRHEKVQTDRALGESAQARVGTAIDMAITDPSPERLANSRKEITEAVSIVGSMAGLPPEAIKAKLSESLSLMHRGVVMRLLDSEQTDEAKAYYYANKKEVGGATQLSLEKSLETSGRVRKAQDQADQIMLKFGGDLAAATAHIEKNFGGEDEKAIRAEVEHRFTVQTAAKNKMSGDAYESAKLAVVQGKKPSASVWAQMDDGHKAAILELQQAKAKQWKAEAEGKEIKTDFATYDTLNRMSWQDPQAFLKLDLQRYSDRLSRADLKAMSEAQQKVGTAEGQKGLATRQQQISATIDQLKLTGNSNAEERGRLTQLINDGVDAESARVGRQLKYDEVQQVIDKQMMQVSVPGFLGISTDKPAYEVKVPKDQRQLIVDALTKAGRKVNEATILELYLKSQKGTK